MSRSLTLYDKRAQLCRQLRCDRQATLQDILLNLQEKLVPVNGQTACILIVTPLLMRSPVDSV